MDLKWRSQGYNKINDRKKCILFNVKTDNQLLLGYFLSE